MAEDLQKLMGEINAGTRVVSLSGLTSISAKACVLAHLSDVTEKRFAVVTESNSELETWVNDLEFFTDLEQKNPVAIAPGSDPAAALAADC